MLWNKGCILCWNPDRMEKIEISSENDPLINAQIHFLSHIHNLKKINVRKASCLIDGSSVYWTYEICGNFFADESAESEIEKDSWIISTTGHAFGEWRIIREATETEAGLETRICENDSTHEEFREIPKISRLVLPILNAR